MSRLTWREKFLPAVSLAGRLNLWNFFVEAKASSSLPLPFKNGVVEDYDYLLASSDAASQYSRHDVYTDKQTALSARLGYRFVIGAFAIEPLAGFSLYNRKWSAADGYLQYPDGDDEAWNEGLPKKNVQGTVISYEQLLWFPCAGFRAGWTRGRFGIGLSVLVYPYIGAQALDSHFVRARQFYDEMEGGIGGSAALSGVWYFNGSRNMGLKASVGFEWFNTVKGETSSNAIGVSDNDFTPAPDYSSGTDGAAFSVTIGLAVKIGG
jgi:outer membrane protease